MRRAVLLAFFAAFGPAASCNREPPVPVPTPGPSPAPVVHDAGPPPAPPAPTPSVTPVPAPADQYSDACANMRVRGCSTGADPDCASTLRMALEQNLSPSTLTPKTITCLRNASTLGALKACGFVKCP